MEQNKGFWYADWSFPIFVGLLSSGVFAGTHMYYLYGIGAFNEVAFVAMLKAGIDTGAYGAVAAFGASFLFARSGAAARRGLCFPGRQLCRLSGHRPGAWPRHWLHHHPGA